MSRANSGFASMSAEKRREVASKGGIAAHLKGTAHRWTQEEARAASLKGRRRSGENGKTQPAPPLVPAPSGLSGQPGAPWLESLRRNLEDLFESKQTSTPRS